MPNLCLSRRLLSVLVLLAWLMSSLLCASAGAQSAPRRGDEPVWQTTAAPEWQSGSAFTEPYPPGENEEGGLRERQDNSSSEPGKSAQTADPSGVPSQAAAAGTPGMPPGKEAGPVDPVIQRLNTAYQEGTGTESGNGGGGESAPSVFGMLLRAVFALALVLGLFFLFVKGLKIMRSMTPAGSSPSVATMRISVADRIPLGSRHSVYLLAVRDRVIVVGTAPGAIVPLAVFSAAETKEPAAVAEQAGEACEPVKNTSVERFRTMLRQALNQAEVEAEKKAAEQTSGEKTTESDVIERDIDALREDIERLRRFLEESGRDRSEA